jgi:hypothetical protein
VGAATGGDKPDKAVLLEISYALTAGVSLADDAGTPEHPLYR